MLRKDLYPGLIVRHKLSGTEAVVRPNPKNPKELMQAHDDYVQVAGISSGRRFYRVWSLALVEKAPPVFK